MVRRFGPLLVLILISGLVWSVRATGSSILQDSDTVAAINGLSRHPEPLYWFTHDWPLENHFYRPISTLFFQMDGWLWPDNARGYGATNALLCIATIWALFWFLLELTSTRWASLLSAVLFGLWVSGHYPWLELLLGPAYLVILVGGAVRHRLDFKRYLPATFTAICFSQMLVPMESISYRSVQWLPGRTATSMTLFALLSMAAYARFERAGVKIQKEPGFLDPPNTRSSAFSKPIKWPLLWITFAGVFLFLALGCHEQAVMLPACLLGVAILLKWQGFKVRWGTQALFWGGLVVYLALRIRFVPSGASGYQLQQFRTGISVWITILAFLAPGFAGYKAFLSTLSDGFLIWLTPGPWTFLIGDGSNISAAISLRQRWIFALGGYLLSMIAFLPMAWIKMFEHYYFWPLALRSLLVVVLGERVWEMAVIGWSPRALSAPQRRDPSPGSLPHP